jgi:gliding motility-associated-like protein
MQRKLILFLAAMVCAFDALCQFCPPNLDFETGTFANWECFTGTTRSSTGVNQILLTPSPPTPGRHEMIPANSTAKDPYGGFPQLCPYGGKHSVKLGNNDIGAQAEGISYTFTVPPTEDTFSFTYFYAVVFEDPDHRPIEQPRFFVSAYDVATGAVINCASYDYISSGGIPGFKQSPVNSSVLYKEWSPASIQFAGLANRTIRLEFKTADCTLSGHFGYAYIDVGSNCTNILATAPYCVETNSVILNAPYGFQTYTWYNHDYTTVIGNQQSLTLSPPPATNGVFHVDIVPYPGYGCRDTVSAVVTPLPVPDMPVADALQEYCQFQHASPLSAVSQPGNDLFWYTSASGGTGSPNAPVPSTSTPGVFEYYVTQKVLFGCESLRKKITVKVRPTPVTSFTIDDAQQCIRGNRFQFTSTSTNLQDSAYQWNFGDAQSSTSGPVTSHVYNGYGTFPVTLTITNGTVCSSTISANVTVIPNPVASFTYPPLICEKETLVQLKNTSHVPGSLDVLSSWWWQVNGNVSTTFEPGAFTPATASGIPVKLVVTTANGCYSDTTAIVLNVRHQPRAAYGYSQPLCDNETVRFINNSSMPAGAGTDFIAKWHWEIDRTSTSALKEPTWNFNAGAHQCRLIAESSYGCKSSPADSVFTIHAKPNVRLQISDSCVLRSIRYSATDLTGQANRWHWNFDGRMTPGQPEMLKYYTTPGDRPLTLIGETVFGCKDTLFRPFTIFKNVAFAGRDTVAARDQPMQLNAHGGPGYTYLWTPSTGMSDPTSETPIALWDRDQVYELFSLTKEGCDSRSRIMIKRYAGPDLYVPTAFTPNKDGRNDLAVVVPVGISKFHHLSIYNRWGELVFTTKDFTKGWDGTQSGKPLATGTFVYIAEATDYNGKPMSRKGTITLIR